MTWACLQMLRFRLQLVTFLQKLNTFRLATKFAETFPTPKLTKHRRQKSLIASSCKLILAFNLKLFKKWPFIINKSVNKMRNDRSKKQIHFWLFFWHDSALFSKIEEKWIDILSTKKKTRDSISFDVFDRKQKWNVENFIRNDKSKLVHVVQSFSKLWRVGRRLKRK